MGSIRQTVTIAGVAPRELYDAFLDSRAHSAMTGARAIVSARVGGTWSAWDGSLSGENVDLVPGERIVQRWRGHDFPPGHFSTVTLKLRKARSATRVELHQTDVPDDLVASYDEGWHAFYWKPMNTHFGRRNMRAADRAATVPSRSRPTKPPAKAIHAHKAAALRSGGGRLPVKMRAQFDAKPRQVRTKPARKPNHAPARATRAGKRVPRRAKKGAP